MKKNVSNANVSCAKEKDDFRKLYNEIFMHHRKVQKEIYRQLNPSVVKKK